LQFTGGFDAFRFFHLGLLCRKLRKALFRFVTFSLVEPTIRKEGTAFCGYTCSRQQSIS